MQCPQFLHPNCFSRPAIGYLMADLVGRPLGAPLVATLVDPTEPGDRPKPFIIAYRTSIQCSGTWHVGTAARVSLDRNPPWRRHEQCNRRSQSLRFKGLHSTNTVRGMERRPHDQSALFAPARSLEVLQASNVGGLTSEAATLRVKLFGLTNAARSVGKRHLITDQLN